MNFSFASAPTTPFIAQTDGRAAGATLGSQLFPPNASNSGPLSAEPSVSRATDPLNDVGSPVNMQYLQFAINNSPFFMSDSGLANIASPTSAALGLPPKRVQPQPVITAPSPTISQDTAAMPAMTTMAAKAVLSPVMAVEEHVPGYYHPSDVFRTPEIRTQPLASTQQTPVLALFEDAEALNSSMNSRVLSPGTQNAAQTGLSLLAASVTFAQDGGVRQPGLTPTLDMASRTGVVGSPFLNSRGENATLMSQPHNSLMQHLSPPMVDHGMQAMPSLSSALSAHGAQLQQQHQQSVNALTAGRLTRNRSMLRQSSGLTSASFHNDLVPQTNESFFAPLDEVCSDNDQQQSQQQPQQQQQQQQQQAGTGVLVYPSSARAQPLSRRPPTAGMLPPRMGSQFSPVMNMPTQKRFAQLQLQPQPQQQLQPQPQTQSQSMMAPQGNSSYSQRQWLQSPQQATMDLGRQGAQPGYSNPGSTNGTLMGPPSAKPAPVFSQSTPSSTIGLSVQNMPISATANRANGVVDSTPATAGSIFSQIPPLSPSAAPISSAPGGTTESGEDEFGRNYSPESHASDSTTATIDEDDPMTGYHINEIKNADSIVMYVTDRLHVNIT
ncbi:hypothetical protein GGI07_002602 [Coemansia sp. Benny D115]|nr:hypothetical protein GGI07_002602 [Coemansia sp. Benny D115]